MSDFYRRTNERIANCGSEEAAIRLLAQRVRSCEVSRDRITFAAHLGSTIARAITSEPYIITCNHIKTDNCSKCINNNILHSRSLIRSVESAFGIAVDMIILCRWSADCLRRISDNKTDSFFSLIRNLTTVTKSSIVTDLQINSELMSLILEAQRLLEQMTAVTFVGSRLRFDHRTSLINDDYAINALSNFVTGLLMSNNNNPLYFLTVVSNAYKYLGHRADERRWQCQKLTDYLIA